jgi:hypothetical protein
MQTMAFAGGANPQMMMETGMRIRQETDQGIAKLLDPKQKERLDQIALRAEGPLAVARPEIAAKLGLNETQQEYIQGIVMQMRRELMMTIRQGAASGQFNPGQIRTLTAQLRQQAGQEIGKVIDRKQKTTFNKLLGEPFDIDKLDSETASADATLAAPADPSKPGETPQAKDAPQTKEAPAADKEETTKQPARKKGRPR